MTCRTLMLTAFFFWLSAGIAHAKTAPSDPVITPKEAISMITATGPKTPVVVLDTRGVSAFEEGHLPDAQPIAWAEFSAMGKDKKGLLLGDQAVLARKLGSRGVSNAASVVVVGDPKRGWGEEGRIVWMLRSLGHTHVAMVDGGWPALLKAGAPVAKGPASAPKGTTFKVTLKRSGGVTLAQVKALLEAGDAQFLDTREAREYRGQTPYGESRGGHLPGAVNLHYKELLDPAGFILPRDQVVAKLEAAGLKLPTAKPVVAYCTGGVRSAWVALVLEHYGITSVNYAGSMWEWAAQPPDAFPLQTSLK